MESCSQALETWLARKEQLRGSVLRIMPGSSPYPTFPYSQGAGSTPASHTEEPARSPYVSQGLGGQSPFQATQVMSEPCVFQEELYPASICVPLIHLCMEKAK